MDEIKEWFAVFKESKRGYRNKPKLATLIAKSSKTAKPAQLKGYLKLCSRGTMAALVPLAFPYAISDLLRCGMVARRCFTLSGVHSTSHSEAFDVQH